MVGYGYFSYPDVLCLIDLAQKYHTVSQNYEQLWARLHIHFGFQCPYVANTGCRWIGKNCKNCFRESVSDCEIAKFDLYLLTELTILIICSRHCRLLSVLSVLPD